MFSERLMEKRRKMRKYQIFYTVLFAFSLIAFSGNSETIKIEFSNLAKILPWQKTANTLSLNGLTLHSCRNKIKSSERWFDILVKLDTNIGNYKDNTLKIAISDISSNKTLFEKTEPVLDSHAIIRIDMRNIPSETVKLRAEWFDNKKNVLGVSETWISANPIKPLTKGTKIPITIDIPEGVEKVKNYPLRFGLPLPAGSVWEPSTLRVVNAQGREIPSQLETAGLWSEEGSIKWLWVDTLVSGKKDDKIYVEANKRSVASTPSTPLRVEKKGDTFFINTGIVEYVVEPSGSLIKEVRFNNKVVAKEGSSKGLYVIDQNGRLAKASSKNSLVKLESKGPVSAVVRIEGDYITQDEPIARHITRLKFSAGRPEVKVTHTFIVTEDTEKIWFKDIGWELEVASGLVSKAIFCMSPANDRFPADKNITLKGWAAYTSEKTDTEKQDIKIVSLPISDGKVYRSIQKEGKTFGLKPSIYHWTRKNPTTPWTPYLKGENVAQVIEEGTQEPLYQDKKIGDWAGLEGKDFGFIFSCRDASAQHPKEFEVTSNRINLKLFSSKVAGDELDFKMESVMKNWGMLPKENIPEVDKVSGELLDEYISSVSKHSSNAVGWSKTHHLLLSPTLTNYTPNEISFLHSRQVFAHISPEWVRETEVFGALHPKNKQEFPFEETLISNLFWGKVKQGLGGELGGFIDYNAGPIWIIHDLRGGSYTIRSDSWYLYARSGDRLIREFAEGANRAFLDNNISHWNFTNKRKGFLLNDIGTPGSLKQRNRPLDLPLYWVGTSNPDKPLSTAGNLDQALFDYYMTGYRRAGDILSNYSDAVVENVTSKTKHWRVISVMRNIAEAYEFSWHPKLKELLYELTLFHLYDPESEILLTKARPHRSSTYKMETDGDVLVMLYEIFGDKLFYEMAKSVSIYNWEKSGITPPIYGQNRSTGYMGHFLWRETFEPSVASRFDYSQRRLVAERTVDYETGEVKLTCVSQIPRYFKGLPLAMDVKKEVETRKIKPSTYISFKVDKPPARIFFIKPGENATRRDFPFEKEETSMDLIVMIEGSSSAEHFTGRQENGVLKPWTTGGKVKLKPHSVFGHIWAGNDLHTITEKSYGVFNINIPKDAPGGLYELEINGKENFVVFTDRHTPLVIYAPDGWTPPALTPPLKISFRVQKGVENGKIFIEKGGTLFMPNGELFNDGKKMKGWVELPSNSPGLWALESVDSGLIKTENMPSFFAMGNQDLYKIPLIKKLPPLEKISGSLKWPSTWRVFGPFHQNDPILKSDILNSYPEKIVVAGKEVDAIDIDIKGTIYDFPNILKQSSTGSVAYIFLTFNSDKKQKVTLGMGADWWMQAWINGKLIHNTVETSNMYYPFSIWNHLVDVDVLKGKNILAVRYIRAQSSQLALGGPDQLRITSLPATPEEVKQLSQIEKEFNIFLNDEI